jgi:cytochrome c5
MALAGCGDDASQANSESPNSTTANATTNNLANFDCEPSRAEWDSEVSGIVETHCGTCHGDTPNFGAPHTLTSYESLMEIVNGQRLVDRSASRVAFGTMPPAGVPDLRDADIESFVEWASCGDIEPELGTGLKVDRPVFLAPEDAPEGIEFFDVRADDFPVGEDVLDLYQCFTVDAPVTSDKFIRRLEVVVDQSEVIHHVVLLRDPQKNAPDGRHPCPGMPQNSDYLYAWAPGGGPIQFPEGGLRVTPGERFVLQVHYNNAVAAPDVVDTSGVRLYYDEPVGTEYGMVAPGPLAFSVAPSATEDVSGRCEVSEETTILAGMPHMHEIGKAFEQVLERADGTMEPVITLENWEFETQLFYSIPITMMPGDTLHTTCTFDNDTQQMVRSGERTQDEMCFNFMYVTPPPASRYCDSSGQETAELTYMPGQCLPEPPIAEPNLSTGTFDFGGAPVPTGGALADGIYELTDFTVFREGAATPIGDIDPEASQLLARGQLIVTEGQASFDADFKTIAALESGQSFDSTNDISISGAYSTAETTMSFALTCPEQGAADFEYSSDGTTVQLQRPGEAFGVGFMAVYTFVRQDI